MSLVFNYNKDMQETSQLRLEYLRNQVQLLKNIHQPEQKSAQWYEMRQTMLTASDWGTVLGVSPYGKSNSVLLKKCGEDNFITNDAMKWGNKYEDVAVLVYEHRNNVEILAFGCLRHPYIPFLGASPDGITKDGIMLEIKCPSIRVIDGVPPAYYWCQVQGQLEVCELDRCDFLECNFKEYENEDEYLLDNFNGDPKLNKFGNEKGIVAEFYKKREKVFYYDYSPVSLLGDEMEKWKIEIIKKHLSDNVISAGFNYWYLQDISCVPIYRNQEWFNVSKIELDIFWKDVVKYRALGLETLKEDIQKNKKVSLKAKEVPDKKHKKTKDKTDAPAKKQKKIKDFINLNEGIDTKSVSDTASDEDYTDNFLSNSSTSLFNVEEEEPNKQIYLFTD